MRARLIGLLLAIGLALPAAPGFGAWPQSADVAAAHHMDGTPCSNAKGDETAPAHDAPACCIAPATLFLPAPDKPQDKLTHRQLRWALPSDPFPEGRPPRLDPHPPRL